MFLQVGVCSHTQSISVFMLTRLHAQHVHTHIQCLSQNHHLKDVDHIY